MNDFEDKLITIMEAIANNLEEIDHSLMTIVEKLDDEEEDE
jgi:hypothetical protein